MGIFKKIQEMIQRAKTPKLNAGNEYERQESNQNTGNQTYTITLPNNQVLQVTSIQSENRIKHSDGEITNIMLAKVYCTELGAGIKYSSNAETLAFELTEGTEINDVILQKIGQYYNYERNMPDNNKECMYLGRISPDPYELGTNNKSQYVNNYINEIVVPRIAQENEEQRNRQLESFRQREEGNKDGNREFVNRMQEEHKQYLEQQNNMKMQRLNNPYLEQRGGLYKDSNGNVYHDYDGVNVLNGDYLRLRKMSKVGKDENGTYLYTGYVQSTPNEYEDEVLSKDQIPYGVPVCFATDRKIEEIIQSINPNDVKSLLNLLSQAEQTGNMNLLNYIGKIDRSNNIDKNIGNTSQTIIKSVKQLEDKFYNEKLQEEQMEY